MGELKGGVIDEGGGMDSDDLRVERVDIDVEAEDSLDREGRTSISSWTCRFRLRDMVCRVVCVFIVANAAAAALRFVDEACWGLVCGVSEEEEVVVDRVWRVRGYVDGDMSIVWLMSL